MSTHVDKNTKPLHAPHYTGAVNTDNLVVLAPSAKNPIFRYPNPDHAVTSGYKRDVWTEHTANSTVATNFFQTNGAFVTLDVPEDSHEVQRHDFKWTFKNNDGTDSSMNCLPCFLMDKIEVNQGDRTLETIRDLDIWFDQNVYTTKEELERYSDTTRLSDTTRKVSFTVTAGSTANAPPCIVPIRTVVPACGIPPALLHPPLTYKVTSAGRIGTDVVNGTDFQITDFKFDQKQSRVLDEQMAKRMSLPEDYRYLKPKVFQKTISLTNGSETQTTIDNFSDDDLCSHMWVVLRSSSLTGSNRETFLDYATTIYLEDENGQNVTAGIQWKGTDLTNIHTHEKFTNDFLNYHKIYLVFCPSSDPVSDYRKGAMNGAQPLGKNWKLKITSNATATVNLEVRAYCYKHVRVEGGQLKIY